MDTEEKPKVKKSVFEILRGKFPENEYAIMEEVSDKAGFDRSRSADYMFMGLYPSRGLSLHGVELKRSRGDWLRELKQPAKAENIFQYCDYFWLLTTDETVARIDEIPASWGWLNIKNEKIFVKKPAPLLEPKQITKSFLAAMLKRACSKVGYVRLDAIQEKLDAAKLEGKNWNQHYLDQMKMKHDEMKELIEEFAETSGINLLKERWTFEPKQVGSAVKYLTKNGPDEIRKKLQALEASAEIIRNKIAEGLKSLPIQEEISEPVKSDS